MSNRTRLNTEDSSSAILYFGCVKDMTILLFESQRFELVPLKLDFFTFLFAHDPGSFPGISIKHNFYFILLIK